MIVIFCCKTNASATVCSSHKFAPSGNEPTNSVTEANKLLALFAIKILKDNKPHHNNVITFKIEGIRF